MEDLVQRYTQALNVYVYATGVAVVVRGIVAPLRKNKIVKNYWSASGGFPASTVNFHSFSQCSP